MKYLFLGSTIISSLLMFGVPAFSQDRDRADQNRDEHYWAGHLFDRVRADIEQAQASTPVFSSDEFRLARTKEQLSALQRSAAAGRFDQDRDLDDVISSLQRVVSDNRMPQHDRDMLNEDLNRLRDFKEHHEHYYPKG